MLIVVFLVVAVAVLFGAAVVATRSGEVLAEAPADRADLGLPALGLQPDDLAGVRLGMVVRGYRMSDVDEVIARSASALWERDQRITELERTVLDLVQNPRLPSPPPAPPAFVAVESAPVESAPVDSAPVEAAPVEAAPVEAAAVEQAPVEEGQREEAPLEVVTPATSPTAWDFGDAFPEVTAPLAAEPEAIEAADSFPDHPAYEIPTGESDQAPRD